MGANNIRDFSAVLAADGGGGLTYAARAAGQ